VASTFKNSLSLCGLSQSEAAIFFDVRVDTIQNWCQNKTSPPQGVWEMLAVRMRSILDAADYSADHIDISGIDPRAWSNITVSLGLDDLDQAGEEMAGAMSLLMVIDDPLSD
jgi:hypothetical protein